MDRMFDLGIEIPDEVLFVGATLALSVGLILALLASKRKTGLVVTPVTLFFVFAYLHAVFARYTAFLTTKYTFIGAATLEAFINESFLIVSTGLTCCFVTYAILPAPRRSRIASMLSSYSNERALTQIRRRSYLLILIAVPLIVIGLQRLGGIPLLSDNMRQDRYLLNFQPEHRLDTFLVNRGRELIVIPMAALALSYLLSRRRVVDLLVATVAVGACLLTATRAPILNGILFVLAILVWWRSLRGVFITITVAIAGLIASEVVLGDASPRTSQEPILERVGEDLPKVRDLGWVLVKEQDQRYWGATFLAGSLPIPAFASDFTDTYHLRTITLNAIGFPLTAGHGGLRITYSGEWFLNFGWAGIAIGGFFYGWLCSRFSQIFHQLRLTDRAMPPVGVFMLACVWVALSFMLYLSGSAVGGTLKTYAGAVLFLTFRIERTRPTSAPHSQRPWTREVATW